MSCGGGTYTLYWSHPLGLERMLALFCQPNAKGGVDFFCPQISVAVTCWGRAVSQFDRAVSVGRDGRGFIVVFM